MKYSPAIQVLVDEHDTILGALEALETMARRAHARPFPQSFYEQALDFFPTFADKFHHTKEEGRLFPALTARGIPADGGPIACMLHDHEAGRTHLSKVRTSLCAAANGNARAKGQVRRAALAYVALLRHHIYKENEILFVMGEQVLTTTDKNKLRRSFGSTGRAVLPLRSHQKYLALARELRTTAGLPARYTPAPDHSAALSCGHGRCPQ